VKINVNDGFDADSLQGNIGAEARDYKGQCQFLAPCKSKLDAVHDVVSAKCHAPKHAFFFTIKVKDAMLYFS
jgi:hypothetical protein